MFRRPAALIASCVVALAACGSDGSARIDELIGGAAATAPPATSSDDAGHGRVSRDTATTDDPGTGTDDPGSGTGTDTGTGTDVPAFMPTVCPFEIEVSLTVTCGVVDVPARRDRSTDRTVELAVAVLRTPAADPAPDPVVYLAGGPGGVSLAEHFIWLSGADDWQDHPILSRRDMVLVDQRGTGYSRPSLWCDEERESPEDCHSRLVEAGLDLSAFSTRESALDLVDVRRALGLDQWNLYGSSYGTRVALTKLRDHPEGIRSVVLEGVYPTDVVPAYHEYVDHALRALDEVAAACAAETVCARRYGDVTELLVRALRTVDSTPRATIDVVEMMDLVFGSLYTIDGVLDLPLALELAAAGAIDDAIDVLIEGAGFAKPSSHDSLAAGDPTEDSAGLFHSIECREEIAFTDLGAIERRADELFEAGVDGLLLDALVAGIAYPIEEICPWWDSGIAPADERLPTVSEIPVLLLSGRFDPITPPAWGDRAAATLPAATHVVAPNLSHSLVLEDPCIDRIVGWFLDDPTAAADTSCVEEMRMPMFTR